MSSPPPLVTNPCRARCSWQADGGDDVEGLLLTCSGCQSQWRPGLGWTPVDADGRTPAALRVPGARHR